MSVEVRIPSRRADRPAGIGVGAVALVCAALGLWLASLGMTPVRGDEEPPEPRPSRPEATGTAGADGEEVEPPEGARGEAPEGQSDESDADPEAAPVIAAAPVTDEIVSESEEMDPPSEAASALPASPGPASALAASAVPASPVPASGVPVSPTESLPVLLESPARLERGRVAYLRCTGVERRGSPFPCPRDEAFEIRAWNALNAIAGCPTLTDAHGQADVVLDFRETGAPEIRSRDTFARDVRRVDAAAVLACALPSLSALRHQTGARRLVVSLRFALR